MGQVLHGRATTTEAVRRTGAAAPLAMQQKAAAHPRQSDETPRAAKWWGAPRPNDAKAAWSFGATCPTSMLLKPILKCATAWALLSSRRRRRAPTISATRILRILWRSSKRTRASTHRHLTTISAKRLPRAPALLASPDRGSRSHSRRHHPCHQFCRRRPQ